MSTISRNVLKNNPISHCKRGQGGRTFSRMKPDGRGHKKGSEHRPLRVKLQPAPMGRDKYLPGFYRMLPMDCQVDNSGKPVNWTPDNDWPR